MILKDFRIQNLDFSNKFFPSLSCFFKKNMEKFGMAVSPIWKNGFLKLHDLFASLFFRSKIRMYFRKNLFQAIRCDAPRSQGSFPIFWRDIGCDAAKSVQKPRDDGKFCVSYFQGNCIDAIRSFLGLPLFDSKASFRVNKTGQIREVVLGGNDCSSLFIGFFNHFLAYKILHHGSEFTDKLKYSQDPQRLSGLGPFGHAIVRTLSKDWERGITRLSA